MGARSVYVSDSSRVGNSVYALYLMSGEEEYKRSAVMLGDALLRWFGGEALLPGCQFDYEKNDLGSIQSRKRLACPEFYDAPMIFLANLYSATGDERYKEQIIRIETEIDTVLVLSGVTGMNDLDKFPYRPKYILNHVGEIAAE